VQKEAAATGQLGCWTDNTFTRTDCAQ